MKPPAPHSDPLDDSAQNPEEIAVSRSLPQESAGQSLELRGAEPPVVARMVIEIRSDGSRTIARGALEDVQNGERVALEAQGSTPLALALSLSKSLLTAPLLARELAKSSAERAVRALFSRGKSKRAQPELKAPAEPSKRSKEPSES